MADVLMQRVGPVIGADGSPIPGRASRDGAQVNTNAHGIYYEAVSRGNVWTISTPTAGATVTANMVVSVASSNAIVGLYNPTTNYNLHIIRTVLSVGVSLTTACNFFWQVLPTTSLNPAPLGVQRAKNMQTFALAGHRAKAFDSSVAVSGTGAPDILRAIIAVPLATAPTVTETDGDIVVGPGAFAGVYVDVVTTTPAQTVRAALTWEEVLV